jgi:hypothetical protein
MRSQHTLFNTEALARVRSLQWAVCAEPPSPYTSASNCTVIRQAPSTPSSTCRRDRRRQGTPPSFSATVGSGPPLHLRCGPSSVDVVRAKHPELLRVCRLEQRCPFGYRPASDQPDAELARCSQGVSVRDANGTDQRGVRVPKQCDPLVVPTQLGQCRPQPRGCR